MRKWRRAVEPDEPPESGTPAQVGEGPSVYDQDGMRSHHDHSFMTDPEFRRAYGRGVQAAGEYGWHWRVHIGLWAAKSASKLTGDFVECGVNRGFLSSAIMEHLDWDSLGKTFYLLDTFAGMDERYLSQDDLTFGAVDKNRRALESGFYVQGVESVRRNFAQWRNVRIIQGPVPATLSEIATREIAYLHLDMNCALPEVATFEYLWERLVPGAFVLFDDYAYVGYRVQKLALDRAAQAKGVPIAALPTGQGLLLKPAVLDR
jgi:hypothetical protein